MGFPGKPSTTAKVASEKTQTMQGAPRDAVSARELKDLLLSHKSSLGVNTSFGSSLQQTPKTARSTRNSKPNYATIEAPDVVLDEIETEPPELLSVAASVKDGISTIARKPSDAILMMKCADNSFQFVTTPSATTGRRKLSSNATVKPSQSLIS